MGPSHVFVLFASLATCAMGMYPNNLAGGMPQGGMPQGGMPQGGMPQGRMPQGAMSPMALAGGFGQQRGMMGPAAMRFLMAKQLYDRKRSIMKQVIKLYENHGCVDPMQKVSNELPFALLTSQGCSNPRANVSCRAYGLNKVNFRMTMMQNTMGAARRQMLIDRMERMSPYNMFKRYLIGPLRGMNPLVMRMVFGNEGPGSGQAFQGERLDSIKNIRTQLLPFQCQDIQAGRITMGMCCPGPVTFDPQVVVRTMAGLIKV